MLHTSRKAGAQIRRVDLVAIAPSKTLSGVGAIGGTAGEKPDRAMPVYAYDGVGNMKGISDASDEPL
jgi:hypothetical protein